MFSLSSLKNLRFLRIFIALIILLALIHSFNVNWELIQRSLTTTTTTTTTNDEADSSLYVPPKDSPKDPPLDNLDSDTSIAHIPDKVWHSAKDGHLTDRQRDWVNSWTEKNPSFRQELLTDRSSEAFVRAHYLKTRPDIVEIYEALPIPILRADLFRYLVVLAEGGVWGDLDVTCDKKVADWVPSEYKNETIDMIVGLEFDFEWRGPGTQVASQFCNWVFAAQKSSRNLQVIVDWVIDEIKEVCHTNDVKVQDIALEMLKDVVDVTGPKIMTEAILESLGQLLGETIDDRNFSGIKHPKLIGDVLIMPGASFAASQNGYPEDQGDPLVTHHYEGSWKQADAEAKDKKKHKEQ